MAETAFLDSLPVERRLALSYAPKSVHMLWLGLFALDARLAGIVRSAHEPALAQIKLAWWRDELGKPAADRRRGEPLLQLLEPWGDEAAVLGRLADGWEILLGDQPLSDRQAEEFAGSRAAACLSLARRMGLPEAGIAEAARGWALAEIAQAAEAPNTELLPRLKLCREMRPLQLLYALAVRSRGTNEYPGRKMALLAAMRVGLLGI
jgi:phytoene synthase